MKNIIEAIEAAMEDKNREIRILKWRISEFEEEITSLKGQIFDLKEAQR